MKFILIGMAFFKLKIFQGERSFRFYFILFLIGYGIGLSVNYYETCSLIESNFDPYISSKVGVTYHLGRIFTTLACL